MTGLIIKKAEEDQYEQVRDFYRSMTDRMKKRGFIITWVKDVHPSPAFLKESICSGTLYIGTIGETIVSSMVLSHDHNEEYEKIEWAEPLDDSQILVVHALGADPDVTGKGVGRSMVNEAIRIAENCGMRAVRLDVLESNKPAENLYLGCGFEYRGTSRMYYENTGWKNFKMFEKIL